jgi:uncharacterized protein YjbJ (UPF0337 family)
MNVDRVAGNWKQFKGKKRDQFLGKLQERQGIAKDEAEKQLTDWQTRNPDFRWDE